MRLAVCILHYGKAEMTRALHTQFANGDPGHADAVFVLDNASPEPYPGAFERLPENIYWGGALAYAVRRFGDLGYTHLWFCNNDAVFVSAPPYFTRAALRIRWLEKRGGVGLYSPSVTANPYHAQMTTDPRAECTRVRYIDGIAPVINLACLDALGGLDMDGNPYGYGLDVWLSRRAEQAGWNVWVDHALVLRHTYHATAKGVPGFLDEASRAESLYLSARMGEDWRARLAAMQEPLETL
ncbi:MAG: hypothetical protein LIP28_05985 [Deltaproteobacteria bacterium]|nr:hypothetical protein [Deltaproteobacteria bacterium]